MAYFMQKVIWWFVLQVFKKKSRGPVVLPSELYISVTLIVEADWLLNILEDDYLLCHLQEFSYGIFKSWF